MQKRNSVKEANDQFQTHNEYYMKERYHFRLLQMIFRKRFLQRFHWLFHILCGHMT